MMDDPVVQDSLKETTVAAVYIDDNRCMGYDAFAGSRDMHQLTRFNKLPSRTKLQTACEQGSLWLIECSL